MAETRAGRPRKGEKPPNHERDAEIVRLHREENVTVSDLGRRFGITRQRVQRILRRAEA